MPMKWTAAGAAIVATAALAGTPAGAHHSILAIVDKSMMLEGDMVLTKLDWINPHVWFHFSMIKPDGSVVQEVPIEWLGLSALRRADMAGPDLFKIGQHYKVTYNPNRDGSFGGEIVSLMDQTGHIFSETAWQGHASEGQLAPPSAPPVLGIGH